MAMNSISRAMNCTPNRNELHSDCNALHSNRNELHSDHNALHSRGNELHSGGTNGGSAQARRFAAARRCIHTITK